MSIDQYSTTPTNNDLTNYFKTGMQPSQVKTAGWDIMADIAGYSVSLPAAAGSANALTTANARPFGALVAGLLQVLKPTAANTGPASFAPDGLGAANIYANGMALAGGELQPNVPAFLKYDGTQWNLLNPAPPGKNFMVDPCCRVAQGASAALSTSRQYGQVDLVQVWAAGTVTGGSIVQNTGATFTPPTATGYSCKILGASISGVGKVFFRRWIESRDAAALQNKTVLCSVVLNQNTGGNMNAFLTINTATAQDNFASITNIGTGATVSVPSGVATPITAALSMGSCGNGVEIILEVDCGAVAGFAFNVTDWQACISTLSQVCAVPRFEDDYAAAMRYFEKSYEYGTVPGTATVNGSFQFKLVAALSNTFGLFESSHAYRAPKVVKPAMTIYSPNSGASGNFYDFTAAADKAITVTPDISSFFVTNNSGGTLSAADAIRMHWVADARL